MKIALLSKSFLPNIGGVETSSAMLATIWTKAGHEVEIVTAVRGDQIYDTSRVLRKWGLRVLYNACTRADIVFTNGYSRLAVIAAALARKRITVLHQGYQFICSDGLGFRQRKFHDFSRRKDFALAYAESPIVAVKAVGSWGFDWALRVTGRWVSHVVPSQHVKKRMGLSNATVMYQPPNPLVVSEVSRAPRSDFATIDAPIRFFGRLVFEKGVDDLILAYHTVLKEIQHIPALEIFGEGPERGALVALTRELGLDNRVKFHGFVSGETLVQKARSASLVVVPSRWEEPGATIAVELYLAGASVLASKNGATGEIFAHHGRLFTNCDVQSLARALRSHLNEGPRYANPQIAEPWTLAKIEQTALEIVRGRRL